MKLSHRFASLFLIALAAAVSIRAADAPPQNPAFGKMVVPYYGTFSEFPFGAIKPKGWIERFLKRQADGLSGHPENMAYPYDTCMFSGEAPDPKVPNGQPSWWRYEQSGYFVDGITRLSHLVDDPSLRQRRDANLDYILEHSRKDSLGASTEGWPNAVIGRALWAQFSATGDPRYAQILQRYLTANGDALIGKYRNGLNSEEALLLYGVTGDQILLNYARKVYDSLFQKAGSWCETKKILDANLPFDQHGVTAAETLKIIPLMYLFSGNPETLALAKAAYDKVIRLNSMPDGGIVSQEKLRLTQFESLHESCDIVDWSWGMGYLFMATGDPRWADRIERTSYNALPGAISKDFKQAQYFSSANQLVATTTSNLRMTYRAAHDTPCCVGNLQRCMPNHVGRMWMRTGSGDGIAAVFYGPSELRTCIGNQPIVIREETDYPFRDVIKFIVNVDHPCRFDLLLRVPGWCEAAGIKINGVDDFATSLKAGSFAKLTREFHDGDIITLTLPMKVCIESWFDKRAASVVRGPLVYSLRVHEKIVALSADTEEVKKKLKGHQIQGFPALDITPTSEWRYGMTAELAQNLQNIRVIESPVGDNPFAADTVPVRLEIPLTPLPQWLPEWSADKPQKKSFVVLPDEPALRETKTASTMTLIPYGATYLRLTTLPILPRSPLIPTSKDLP